MTNEPLLRLALVGPLPPPSGGMANQMLQLAELLRSEGIVVEVVQVNAPYRYAWIERMRGIRALFRMVPYFTHLWRAAGRNDLFHVMANSGWSWHLFAAPAIVLAKLRGKAVVVHYHGGEAEVFFERSIAWIKPILKYVDAIVVPSGFLGQVFAKRGFTARIVPNIVNLQRFIASNASNQRASNPHILVARNLEHLYDNATALRAFARIRKEYPEAQLTIAGSGPEREALEQLAKRLNIVEAVTFAGRVDNERMPALYRSANIALNPSLVDNTPISILEALASGVPVVSTNVGGVPFLVEEGKTALLVPPQDPERMAEAVLRLLLDEPLRERLVQAGLDHARQFAWEAVREKLFSAYAVALGRPMWARSPEGR